jgi:DNA-binding transcriptional regulator YhcF (GntR family)
MSFQAMTWAIEQELKVKEKMVLLMLANYCNGHTGQCNPSLPTLAKECGMSKDSVIRAIKILESEKFVTTIRQKVGLVNLPNQYVLAVSSPELQPVVADSDYQPSRSQRVGGSCELPEPGIQPTKRTTTTQTENFENFGTKLNALHREVFEWACTDKYWVRCTNSEEDFLRAYCSPKGGMRKQFEERNNVKQPTGGNNGTHRQPPKKLSPAERVRKAAGIGEFAIGAGGSEFDYLENRG